jgi:hypothetical protein
MSFWDSSALVPLITHQEHSEAVRHLAKADAHMLVWWGTPVECVSALSRLVRERVLTAEQSRIAESLLGQLMAATTQILPSDEVRARAMRLLAVHPLRAADALQLAAALVGCGERPAGTLFVCLDQRLREVASLEGFSVIPP